MITTDFLTKNKAVLINSGIIVLALFVSFYLYGMQGQQIVSLEESKNEEIKKSEVMESLNRVEKRIDRYKSAFTRKDLGMVIAEMTEIAKDSKVKVISVKPGLEQTYPDYIKSSFLIVVRVPDYHALGKFISMIENYKELFLVEDVNISTFNKNKVDSGEEEGLDISLKISTITCL
jgi:uncharacterized ubiquitin-like protein YukD